MTTRPKWQIALELWAHAVANGARFEWLTLDEEHAKLPEMLFRLDDAGQRYVGEGPVTFTGRLVKPALLYREHHRPVGRR